MAERKKKKKSDEGETERETKRALRGLATIGAVVAVATVATLLLPEGIVVGAEPNAVELDRLKPWRAGDPIPVIGLFAEDPKEVPAFAGAGGSYIAPGTTTRRVEERLGKSIAANLGESAGVRRTRHAHQGPAIVIEPEEYEGIDVEIERPEALRPFFEALERTARNEAHAVTRIAHYGDSSIATDLMTYTVRRQFQQRFGDAGHGFHLMARGTMPYGHRDVVHRASDGWELRQIVREQDREGLYGYGGVAFRPVPGEYASFATAESAPVGQRVSRFDIYYRSARNGGRLRYRVDRGETETLDTRDESEEDRVHRVEVPDGAHRLEIRTSGGGPVRLYGVAMERDRPGVVYDSLGMVGARARRLLDYDQAHIRRQLELRGIHLVVLGFGGNEADDPVGVMRRNYEPEFARVIERMRAGREDMACLVFAPLDQASRDSFGRIETLPGVPVIVEAQRRAAARQGCAFYDTFAAMGGVGAMRVWARERPRLALDDYRHATPAGYEVIGNMFYKALLKAFAEYLAR
jgi:lysophospholipase L1-like esterase